MSGSHQNCRIGQFRLIHEDFGEVAAKLYEHNWRPSNHGGSVCLRTFSEIFVDTITAMYDSFLAKTACAATYALVACTLVGFQSTTLAQSEQQFSWPLIPETESRNFGCEGPDSGTFFEACVLSSLTDEADAQTEKIISQALVERSLATRGELFSSQKAWAIAREKSCDAVQTIVGGINSISFVRCRYLMTRQRLDFMKIMLGSSK